MRATQGLMAQVTAWRVSEPRSAHYGPWPEGLSPELRTMLAKEGIQQLYSHQSDAVTRALCGQSVVVAAATASGKSLCYNLPVLNALLADSNARALYLFPTKALAHDQLQRLLGYVETLGLDVAIESYDGDTPPSHRAAIRRRAGVVLTNPDMLHVGILPYHTQWHEFLSALRFVVLDELHYYRGVFGSHVANVLRRLGRICRHYGTDPVYVCCSATIANSVDLAGKLTARAVQLVDRDGAPQCKRVFAFYNPPIVDQALGIRRSPLIDARQLTNLLLRHDVQTLVFGRSRLSTELLLTYLRADTEGTGRDPATLRGYRGGYLPSERRDVEAGLRSGRVRGIVATNALELGIDVGGLSAAVLMGYPGTIASMRQQSGRVGRQGTESAVFLVAYPSPLDQYVVSHPSFVLERSPERALINPNNLHLRLLHLQCAAYELPLTEDEIGEDAAFREVLAYLEETGRLRMSKGRWYWAGSTFPAGEFSLRAADPASVSIVANGEGLKQEVIGQMERASTPRWLHEGAIYLHDGQQYAVESLDWEAGVAAVRPVDVNFFTEASETTRIDVQRVLEEHTTADLTLALGEVLVTTRVTSYRRLSLGSHQVLGWGDVRLPEQTWLASACWVALSRALLEQLRVEGDWTGEVVQDRGPGWAAQRDRARQRDGYRCRSCGAPEREGRQHHVHHLVPFRDYDWRPGLNDNYVQANALTNLVALCPNCHRQAEQQVAERSTLSRLAGVLAIVAPLLLMCDPHDLGVSSELEAQQTSRATIFLFDRVPGGVGLCEELVAGFGDLLHRAQELVHDCPCDLGCPACIGPTSSDDKQAKHQVLRLISAMQEFAPGQLRGP